MLWKARFARNDVYWLEGPPREQGRNVIVRAGSDGATIDITPAAFNARTRVHEYGLVARGWRELNLFEFC